MPVVPSQTSGDFAGIFDGLHRAKHSFDANRPDRVYFCHQLAYDRKAAADALERTRKFLHDHMHR